MDKLNVKNEVCDDTSSKIVESTTVIVADTNTVSVDYKTNVLKDDITIRLQNITDFMAKPILVYQGVWTDTDVQSAALTGILQTDNYLNSETMWNDKLSGFKLVRADLIVTVRLNCTPFQQGKLLLTFLPMQFDFEIFSVDYTNIHKYNISTKRMLPCVEIDARTTEATMVIPYITPANFYTRGAIQTGHKAYQRGGIELCVLSPLRAGDLTSNTADYMIYYSWENVEMAAPVYPQMAGKANSKGKYSTRIVQSREERELAAMTDGTISGGLSIAAGVAHSLSGIPLLSSFMSTASWVADTLSGIASAFGYSKPINNVAPVVAMRHNQRYSQNYDGVDAAVPLALSSQNAVTHTSGKSIYDYDELNWNFLKSVSTVISNFSWSSTDPVNNIIFEMDIGPSNMALLSSYTKTPFTVTVATGPPIYYYSNIFKQYRGSIDLTIKFAKTEFHSGRIEILFTPIVSDSVPATPTVPPPSDSHYSLREIIDIRTGSEICLSLPYLFGTDYLPMKAIYGTLTITVLNQLRAPSTAYQTINALVYANGGKDLDFAIPSTDLWKRPVIPQMNSNTAMCEPACIIEEAGVGGEPTKNPSLRYSQFDVGEHFNSVRQLLARYSQFFLANPVTDLLPLWPYFTSLFYVATTTGITSTNVGGDMFSYVSPCYAFYRGGVRVNMTTPTSTQYSSTLCPSMFPTQTSPITNSTSGPSNLGISFVPTWYTGTTRQPVATNYSDLGIGTYAFQVPYYSKTPVSLNVPLRANTIPLDESQSQSVVVVRKLAVSFELESFHRSIAEDFQFTYFVGCPPLIISIV